MLPVESRRMTKIIVVVLKVLWFCESIKSETAAYNAAFNRCLIVLETWRQEFKDLAIQYRKETGQGLNLGLLYSGALKDLKLYGAGIPMFWSRDYWENEEIVGDLCLNRSTAATYNLYVAKDFNRVVTELVSTSPAQAIKNYLKYRSEL